MILVAMMQRKELERRLSEIVRGRISVGEPIARHATLGVGGPADLMVFPKTEEELRGVLRLLATEETPKLILGGGSDLIVRDGGFRGVCVALGRNLTGSKIMDDRTIEAMAGESFASLLRLSRQACLAGLEFLVTVPGTVGGGVATNVGAYGDSFAGRLAGLDLLDARGRSLTLDREAIDAEYRAIRLPEGAVVVRARFSLDPSDKDRVEEKVAKNREHRLRTQPLKESTAGCIFKNPSAWEYAGRLIDEAGLKGFAVGGAAVSELHGNFIVNRGGATARDVLDLMGEVRRRVKERSGVDLEPEVRIVGEES